MKATGIIRRIDDNGRIAIPTEILLNLKIKKSDSLEICTSDDGGIILHKYRPQTEVIASKCAKIVNQAIAGNIILHLFVDGDCVTVVTSNGKATAKCYHNDNFDLNIGTAVALSQLGLCKLPDGLID